jgi:hypothetical protein
MVVRKKKIIVDGQEMEVEMFETAVVPGKRAEEAVEHLLREEEIEKEVNEIIKKIDTIAQNYQGKDKDIWFYYEIGKVLRFVDKKGFSKEKARIWERIGADLRPTIIYGKDVAPKRAARYLEQMYLLAKQKKGLVRKLDWYMWFEILQYQKIRENEEIVRQVIRECRQKKMSRERLRDRLKEIKSAFPD